MSIKLRHDDAAYVDALPESLGLFEAGLPYMGVHDEDNVVRLYHLRHLLHLVEERLLLLVSTRRIYNDEIVLLFLEELNSLLGNLHGIRLIVVPVEGNADLGRILPELIEGASTEGICAHQRCLPAFPVVVVRILGAGRCLAAALKPYHHDNIALALFELVWLLVRRNQPNQLLHYGLLDEFPLVNAAHIRLEKHTFLHVVPEFGHVADIHVCLEQRCCNFLQHLIQQVVIDDGSSVQLAERGSDLLPQL
mmetsp:Transcript_56921/g.123161  ORF Transcript_56921/g.123161 Transcript_56921/m.123161 type:complete len:250 (+) Transcript_56921:918-1667(+)